MHCMVLLLEYLDIVGFFFTMENTKYDVVSCVVFSITRNLQPTTLLVYYPAVLFAHSYNQRCTTYRVQQALDQGPC